MINKKITHHQLNQFCFGLILCDTLIWIILRKKIWFFGINYPLILIIFYSFFFLAGNESQLFNKLQRNSSQSWLSNDVFRITNTSWWTSFLWWLNEGEVCGQFVTVIVAEWQRRSTLCAATTCTNGQSRGDAVR